MAVKERDVMAAGKAIAAEIVATYPEDQRAALQAAYDSNPQAVRKLGEGGLRHDEFSRNLDEIRAWKSKLDTWYTERQADLEEAARLKRDGGGRSADGDDGFGGGSVVDDGKLKAMETRLSALTSELQQTQAYGSQLMAMTVDLSNRHRRDFGDELEAKALYDYAAEHNQSLTVAYDEMTSDRRKAKADADLAKKLQEARDDERLKTLREMRTTPYPINTGEPTVLDRLRSPDSKPAPNELGVQAAVGEFMAGQTARP